MHSQGWGPIHACKVCGYPGLGLALECIFGQMSHPLSQQTTDKPTFQFSIREPGSCLNSTFIRRGGGGKEKELVIAEVFCLGSLLVKFLL